MKISLNQDITFSGISVSLKSQMQLIISNDTAVSQDILPIETYKMPHLVLLRCQKSESEYVLV